MMTKTSDRQLNWHGWSLATIAAVYESDAAAREAEADPKNASAQAYWESAWRAEEGELKLDGESKSEEHPIDCTCIFCIPGA